MIVKPVFDRNLPYTRYVQSYRGKISLNAEPSPLNDDCHIALHLPEEMGQPSRQLELTTEDARWLVDTLTRLVAFCDHEVTDWDDVKDEDELEDAFEDSSD
jgi:hypothetical protein